MQQNAVVEQVLALTREMEHAVSLADWPEAARLAEIRSPLIMSLNAEQVHASSDAALRANSQVSQTELEAENTTRS